MTLVGAGGPVVAGGSLSDAFQGLGGRVRVWGRSSGVEGGRLSSGQALVGSGRVRARLRT